jgi:Phosphatidylserine/phosphatidylglycerophosphate/cardiolipin synthases and related enzymes|uniref:PLD phosphodiesterase domain-containing protein n=1 Tax=Thermofilum pendens TaxID=2269 RepID=A0A7C3WT63_THEPE
MPSRTKPGSGSYQVVVFAMLFLAAAAFALGYALGKGSAAPEQPRAPAYQGAQLYILNDRDYYPTLMRYLERSNKSIYIMMYVFKSDTDTIARIVDVLVRKAKQGVDVRVILENSIEDNELTYQSLKSGGVRVVYDPRAVTTHSKLVIVDGYVVFVGSHNFSYSAMMKNHEASVMIISEEIASAETEYFMSVLATCSG